MSFGQAQYANSADLLLFLFKAISRYPSRVQVRSPDLHYAPLSPTHSIHRVAFQGLPSVIKDSSAVLVFCSSSRDKA